MQKSRIFQLAAAGGIIGVALVSSALTNFGSADTTNQPTATPAPIEAAAPADSLATPEPTTAPVASPTLTSLQSQVNNHEGRIDALEQATSAPAAIQVVVTPSPTPSVTPFPNAPVCHGSVCVGN